MATKITPVDQPGDATLGAKPASLYQIMALGAGLIFLAIVLVYCLLTLWPGELSGKKGNEDMVVNWFGTKSTFNSTVDARLILLVIVTGALGSFVHTATSFTDFVGNQKLATNWVWWYVLRPFIGMSLAVIFYMAIRAGFLTGGGQADTLNLFGIVAMAGMVGMFAKQATDKLSEVFDTVFRTAPTGGDVERKDGLNSTAPTISLLQPVSVSRSGPFNVKVLGSGFSPSSIVQLADSGRVTVFKNPGELSVTLLPADLDNGGPLELSVLTPPPGGGRSSTVQLYVRENANDSVNGFSTSLDLLDEQENQIDGCAIPVVDITPDQALPAARGGVA